MPVENIFPQSGAMPLTRENQGLMTKQIKKPALVASPSLCHAHLLSIIVAAVGSRRRSFGFWQLFFVALPIVFCMSDFMLFLPLDIFFLPCISWPCARKERAVRRRRRLWGGEEEHG